MSQRDRLVQQFANRFEPVGGDYLFRKTPRRPPIRVTAAERDTFVADFATSLSRVFWLLVLATLAMIVGLVLAETSFSLKDRSYFTYAALVPPLVISGIAYTHYWNAPWYALRTRAVASEGRTREQVREISLSKLTWRHLGLSVLAVLLALARLAYSEDLTTGWNRLWLVGGAIALLMASVQAYRKLRLEIGRKTSS
jgi:hypothetical protein